MKPDIKHTTTSSMELKCSVEECREYESFRVLGPHSGVSAATADALHGEAHEKGWRRVSFHHISTAQLHHFVICPYHARMLMAPFGLKGEDDEEQT